MKKKYVILYWNHRKKGFDYGWWIYKEVIEKKRAMLITPPSFLHNMEAFSIHEKHCTSSFQIIKRMWYLAYLYKMKKQKDEEYIFLINDMHPCLLNRRFLDYLRKKYHAKLVLTIRNPFKNKKKPVIYNWKLSEISQKFDLVVTDEPNDAEEYGMPYIPDPFDNMYGKKRIKVKNDICFCGWDKKRFALLKGVYNEAKKKNVKCDFKVVEAIQKGTTGIQTVSWQPYYQIVKQDMESNCILEILQPGQNGFTLRMQEAISCNKKFLTNNEKAKENKYYNEKYMQVFQSPEEIDFNFVKERIKVDYNYQGDYSSPAFIDKIESLLHMDKNQEEIK